MLKLAGSDSIVISANPTRNGFTTKQRDVEIGWDYFGARYYNPALGRWMAVDPIYDELEWEELDDYGLQSINPYNYVYNSPVKHTDPDGKLGNAACAPFCTAAAGAVVGAGVEYGTQVVGNFLNGKTGVDAFTDVDFADIGVAAVEGALTSGASVGKRLAANVVGEAVRNIIEVKTEGLKIETNATVVVANTAVGVISGVPLQSKVLTNLIPTSNTRLFDANRAARAARESSNVPLSRARNVQVRQNANNNRTAFSGFRQGISDGALNLFPGGAGSALQDRTANEAGRQQRVNTTSRSNTRSASTAGRGGHHRGVTNSNSNSNTRGRGGRRN